MRLLQPASSRKRMAASVLIIVLWVALGLVALALYFGNSMRLELRASENRVAMLTADQAIEGAARYVAQILTEQATNGLVPFPEDYASEAVPLGDAQFWLIGRNDGQYALNEVVFGLVDEGAKLNVNNTNVTQDMLELLPGMTSDLAAAIVHWRSPTSEDSADNGEEQIYARYQPPYYAKGAPFDSVDELRLLNGATLDVLLGEDLNRNGILDPNETDNNRNGLADPGVLEYLTVWSRESNLDSVGTNRVNINSSRDDLANLLTDLLGSGVADRVQQAALSNPNRQFSSILEFYLDSTLTEEEFMQIETEITTEDGTMLPGKVNVNTASAAVLACVPGVGDDQAAALVSYRQSNISGINSVAWVTKVLTRDQVLDAGPYITGQSYQFSADIAALGKFGRGYRRTKFVFDVTEGAPKVVYRQSLSHLGWALGRETREFWLAKVMP